MFAKSLDGGNFVAFGLGCQGLRTLLREPAACPAQLDIADPPVSVCSPRYQVPRGERGETHGMQ